MENKNKQGLSRKKKHIKLPPDDVIIRTPVQIKNILRKFHYVYEALIV